MNIHEYQAKQLLAEYGIPVPKGALANTPTEAKLLINSLPGSSWIVKAQIHAGGRSKAGGIKIVESIAEAEATTAQFLGMNLITSQTGPTGKLIRQVWIEQNITVMRELYLAIVLNRDYDCLSIIASPFGGIDIEEIAANTPDKIFTIHIIEQDSFLWPFQARNLFLDCKLPPKLFVQGVALLQKLLNMVYEKDIIQLEINPLALTAQNYLIALDAKINFDDNALKRHPDIIALNDPNEIDSLERQAIEMGLNYIRLNGNIGTMVNGAGLAMATMDLIKQAGGAPANFLDIGGGANEKMITKGLELILSDSNVKAILINIFGGILRCDILAAGVIAAVKKTNLSIPLIVRLEGTNVEEGRRILTDSGLFFETATSMAEAASKVAKIAEQK